MTAVAALRQPGTQQGRNTQQPGRAVFIHRLGEIRDRTYENQQHRASGLNLLVTAIILWNTRYLERYRRARPAHFSEGQFSDKRL
jgi:TnpA family transposase